MKVIFLKHVENVAKAGEIKDVADGFFRNFLLPHKLAKQATAEALKEAEAIRKKAEEDDLKSRAANVGLLEEIKKTPLIIAKKANAEGQLFGSVSEEDIVKAMAAKGFSGIKESYVRLEMPIKSVGPHQATLRFPHGLEGVIEIMVEKSE